MRQYHPGVMWIKCLHTMELLGHFFSIFAHCIGYLAYGQSSDAKQMIKPTFGKNTNWTIRQKLKRSKDELGLYPALAKD